MDSPFIRIMIPITAAVAISIVIAVSSANVGHARQVFRIRMSHYVTGSRYIHMRIPSIAAVVIITAMLDMFADRGVVCPRHLAVRRR